MARATARITPKNRDAARKANRTKFNRAGRRSTARANKANQG